MAAWRRQDPGGGSRCMPWRRASSRSSGITASVERLAPEVMLRGIVVVHAVARTTLLGKQLGSCLMMAMKASWPPIEIVAFEGVSSVACHRPPWPANFCPSLSKCYHLGHARFRHICRDCCCASYFVVLYPVPHDFINMDALISGYAHDASPRAAWTKTIALHLINARKKIQIGVLPSRASPYR